MFINHEAKNNQAFKSACVIVVCLCDVMEGEQFAQSANDEATGSSVQRKLSTLSRASGDACCTRNGCSLEMIL